MVSSVLSTEYLRVTYMFCRDTVASVGLIRSKTLPFTTTNRTIKTFRHALSLDEVYSHAFACTAVAHEGLAASSQVPAKPLSSPHAGREPHSPGFQLQVGL